METTEWPLKGECNMMPRVLEPELMDDPEQAQAYAAADFAEENQGFVDRFREYFPDFLKALPRPSVSTGAAGAARCGRGSPGPPNERPA